MPGLTLYTPPNYYKSYRVLIAARYSGAQVSVAPPAADQSELKLTDSNDTIYFDATAMAFVVANEQLRNKTAVAEVINWCNWSDRELGGATTAWVYPCLGVAQMQKAQVEKARSSLAAALDRLNKYLTSRTFLVGERITLADITVATNLLLLFQNVVTGAVRSNYPHTMRWFNTIVNQAEVKSVIGEVKLCDKEAQFDAKKFQELHKGGEKKQGAKQPQQQQPKQEKPKQEKKPDEPAAGDIPEEPKKEKDPFLQFEKGTFDMDEWKRTYSNNDIATVAMPYFEEKFDSANYSVWYCEYKFQDELRLTFMTCNLVSGMFQRLDRMRKHAFGVVGIFGVNNDNQISGIWIWRGHELAFTLSEDLSIDYESYTWKKLDFSAPETKQLIREYFISTDDMVSQNRKIKEAKVFK